MPKGTAAPDPDLPLTETTFLILLSLVTGPRHGYAILKDVQQLSEQRVRLSTGTLYGALKRLLELGWIARAEDDAVIERNRPIHSYTLTDHGRRIMSAELARIQALTAVARSRLVQDGR